MIQSKLNEAESKFNGKVVPESQYSADCQTYMNKHGRTCQIYELPRFGTICPGFGINWSAVGTVDINEAKAFAKKLEAACKDVEMLNKKYQGCKIDMDA